MKKLHIHGLWLMLQIISTTQELVNNTNSPKDVTSRTIMLSPTPSLLKYLDKQTNSTLYESTKILVENKYTESRNLQSSDFFGSHAFTSAEERTRPQSVRNLFNNTQTWSLYLDRISTTKNVFIVKPNRTQLESKTTEMDRSNPSSFVQQTFTTKLLQIKSKTVQYTEGASTTYSSLKTSTIHDTKSSSVYGDINSTINGFQSQITVVKSSYIEPANLTTFTAQLQSSSRSYDRLGSSSNYRFLLSTPTQQPSKIVTVLPSPYNASLTERFPSTTSYSNKNYTSEISSESLTSKSLKTLKTPDAYMTTSSRGYQFSRHGSRSSQTRNNYFSSTPSIDTLSRSKTSNVVTIFPNTYTQTFSNKESTNTQGTPPNQSSSKTIALKSVQLTKNILSSSSNAMSELYSTVLKTKSSSFHSQRKSSNEVSDHTSQEILTTLSIVSTVTTSTYSKPTNRPSNQGHGMPLYVLAICLPLAALLGFALAFIYFKRRNEEEQRVRYSVTVEISAEKPDYELKRMYSIIDVSAGINKDVLSALESRKASKDMVDEVDNASVSIPQQDRNV